MDVGVHREEEPGRREAPPAPEAEVEVLCPDDPAEEEVRPLAGAPVARGGEKEEEPARSGARGDPAPLPERGEEAVERRDVVRSAVVASGEEGAEGAVGAKRFSEGPEEGLEGSNVDPPVDEPVEAGDVRRVPREYGGGGAAEGGEDAFERRPD